jgi:outer membrane protein assembly factor BamB
MIRVQIFLLSLLLEIVLFNNLIMAQEAEVKTIFDKTKSKSGMCLIVGAKDLTIVESLAKTSAFYIQVIQPDAKVAIAWGQVVANSANRENISVRNAVFDSDHYGSNLFNLIVVEDSVALGNAKMIELNRILVPDGIVAFKTTLPIVAEAKGLAMNVHTISGYAVAFSKGIKPIEWKPCDSLIWRAGMRAHMANGICGPTSGGGKYFYREFLEPQDGWPEDTTQLVARDAFNGRVLWCKQEGVPRSLWNTYWSGWNWTLSADEKGRLFVITKDQKLVCLDGATGEQLFVLLEKGARPSRIDTHQGKYVFYAGTSFSAETGKELWKYSGPYTAINGETMVESDGITLRVRNLIDGKELVKTTLEWRVSLSKRDMQLYHLGDYIIVADGAPCTRPPKVTALSPTTGEKLWSHSLGGFFAMPPQGEKGKSFDSEVSYTRMGDKLLAFFHFQYFYDKGTAEDPWKEIHFTEMDLATGKVDPGKEDFGPGNRVMGSACATMKAVALGDYLLYHHNVWRNMKTMERVFPNIVHPACSLPPLVAYGMVFNTPGRKGGPIQGITAIGASDTKFDQAPGGKVFVRYAPRPAFNEPTKPTDWPTFRANNARGNFNDTTLGTKLEEVWEAKVGLGGHTYGQMYAERCGLTQAVIAYGNAYVADIWGQRIVALDVTNGKEKWTYHVGSRVDFPATIYNGLCVFASKDGFVHCVDANTGQPIYKLLIAPRERFIGGQDKLESMWPTAADVMIDKKGIGHANAGFASNVHGGTREITFKVDTGEVIDSKVNFTENGECEGVIPVKHLSIYTEPLPGGFQLYSLPEYSMDDMLGFGNSISRNNEDRSAAVFGDLIGQNRTLGKVIAFDDKLCVAHSVGGGEAWALKSPMVFQASSKPKAKIPDWKTEPIEMIADDIVLTPKYVYCVGHYRRIKGDPEIWILSREDGKVISKTPVNGFPAYLGMSASENKLFVSTREGSLICYQESK